jgi:hypothetical protein
MSDGDRIERSIVEGVSGVLRSSIEDLREIPMFPAALARFFEQLLAGDDRWSRYWWIDDAVPERTDRFDDLTVEIEGIFEPGDERHQWIQPFWALLRLDSPHTRLAGYRVCLADVTVPIDAVPYGAKRPREWPSVAAWAFTFEDGIDLPD